MSPETLREIERLCHQALALPASERGAFLDGACGDTRIRREVESLLAVETRAEGLFASAGAGHGEDLGTAGPYEVVEKLGEGGMGLVYRARQTEPVEREVALKIIRPGMASPTMVARFQLERQALAMMDHPAIARVLDAGATSQGLPYMAMELVAGRTITRFCEEEKLSLRQRVELMIPVCLAIQHAHQKGIIHRDIKPSNVMVTVYDGKPAPKVIDFGIAKAVEGARGGPAGATRPGMMVGTFDYVSPEQAEPAAGGAAAPDVDTRTDIYSLGALLYQLLAGRPPLTGLSLEQSTYSELLRRIQEETPPPMGIAARELDWIVGKALEKDRERRYSSADGMARDLRRYLDGEAVEAGPPAAWYRMRKFAGRHRWALAGAGALVVTLVAALAWMSIALRQQQRANLSARALREVVRKIIVERPAQLARMPNRTALRAELMRDAEGALEALGDEAAAGDAGSRLELANAYLAMGKVKGPFSSAGSEGDPAGAARYVRRAVELFGQLAAERPEDAAVRRGELEALATWVGIQYRLHDSKEGERAARQMEETIGRMSAAVREKVSGDWYLSLALVERGMILFNDGASEEGLKLHRRAAELVAGVVPASVAEDAAQLEHWALVQRELAISAWMFAGVSEEAMTAARRGVEALAGCDAPACRARRAQVQGTLGEMLWAAGRRAEGIQTMRESVGTFDALVAEDPANAPYVHSGNIVRNYLALALAEEGAGGEAVALAEKSVRSLAGPDGKLFKGRERRIVHQITLGGVLLKLRRYGDAERQLRETLDGNRDWEPNADLLWSAEHLLAQAQIAQRKAGAALETARRARRWAEGTEGKSYSVAVRRALTALDFAEAVALDGAAAPALREEAAGLLEKRTAGLESRQAVLTGALLEPAPAAGRVAAAMARLRR